MKKIYWLLMVGVGAFSSCATQQKNLLQGLMEREKPKFDNILAQAAHYEVQILYTQIDRDERGEPHFTSHSYRLDSSFYFYPASTVKMALSFLALEKINQLQKKYPNLRKETPYGMDSVRNLQIRYYADTTATNGLPSIAQDIKQIMLVSDNFAYNRLFDFLGGIENINQSLSQKNYKKTKIVHRFSIPGIDNQWSAPMQFFAPDGKIIFQQPERHSEAAPLSEQKDLLKGKAYLDSRDSLVKKPFDFSRKNYFSLSDQQQMLRAVLFPSSVSAEQRFDLTADDVVFLKKYMSMFPRESQHPTYDTSYYDGYCKFLMYGDGKENRPDHIRIFNKVGDAYGYMIDNAYIVDYQENIEFMLSAVLLCNEDGIFNDGNYEYEPIGQPFFGNLGRTLYEYEKKRPRKRQPNLLK